MPRNCNCSETFSSSLLHGFDLITQWSLPDLSTTCKDSGIASRGKRKVWRHSLQRVQLLWRAAAIITCFHSHREIKCILTSRLRALKCAEKKRKLNLMKQIYLISSNGKKEKALKNGMICSQYILLLLSMFK